MSFALIRNDLLVDLANEGDASTIPVQTKVEEFLGKAPGAWLPEGFESGYQLIDRAIKNAKKSGKIILIKAARRVLNELGRAWTFKKLSLKESRQFLGAAILIAEHSELMPENSMDLIVPLHLARERAATFWARVSAVKEIVGTKNEHKAKMLEGLWNLMPQSARNLIIEAERKSLIAEKNQAFKLNQAQTKVTSDQEKAELLAAKALFCRHPVLFEASTCLANPDTITRVLFERVTSVGSILTVVNENAGLPHLQTHPVKLKITMPLRGTDDYAVANAIMTRIEVIRHLFISEKGSAQLWPQYTDTTSGGLDHCIFRRAA